MDAHTGYFLVEDNGAPLKHEGKVAYNIHTYLHHMIGYKKLAFSD